MKQRHTTTPTKAGRRGVKPADADGNHRVKVRFGNVVKFGVKPIDRPTDEQRKWSAKWIEHHLDASQKIRVRWRRFAQFSAAKAGQTPPKRQRSTAGT